MTTIKNFLSTPRVSTVAPRALAEPQESEIVRALKAQLERIDARVEIVTKAILEQTYSLTLGEALSVVDKMRNEPHTARVAGERQELAWLQIRRLTLAQRIAEAQ